MPKGGFRPGSGRKPQPVVEEQEANRDVVLRIAREPFAKEPNPETITKFEAMAYGLFARAINDSLAFAQLGPYLMGAKPREPLIDASTTNDNRTQVINWGPAWSPPELPPEPELLEGPKP